MFCTNCGKPVKDGARFCSGCGANSLPGEHRWCPKIGGACTEGK